MHDKQDALSRIRAITDSDWFLEVSGYDGRISLISKTKAARVA
jgi:hypothetical protein